MTYQLRDYRIKLGAMDEFEVAWREGVVPLREQFGFEVVGAWSNPETNRFVWVVAHAGDFEETDRSYYASEERKALDPDPAQFIEHAKTEFVAPAMGGRPMSEEAG